MRSAGKLFLLAVAAFAAMALTAGNATAQEEPVEVVNEATFEHCDVAAETCKHHMVGTHQFTLHQFGSESILTACNDELLVVLGEDGSGYIDTYENDAATSSSCTRIQCNGVGESASEVEWPIADTGEYTGVQTDEGHLTFRFCFDNESDPSGPGAHCTMEVDIENHGNHRYGLKAIDEECSISGMVVWIGVDGEWESEGMPDVGQDDIEFIH